MTYDNHSIFLQKLGGYISNQSFEINWEIGLGLNTLT